MITLALAFVSACLMEICYPAAVICGLTSLALAIATITKED